MNTSFRRTHSLHSNGVLSLLFIWLLQGVFMAQVNAAPVTGRPQALAFTPSATNEFTFDTGALKGTFRAKGRSMGLSSVTHVPSGTRLDRSLGLFSHYRVFSTNHRYSTAAWDWPSTVTLRPDGGVEVRWAAAADRPFELQATYRWATPNALDVETTVTPRAELPKFESFLASYFESNFTNSLVCVQSMPDRSGAPGLMAAELKYGKWLVFPRDNDAIQMVQDGRWKYPPNPVDWVAMPRLAKPLGVRRDPVSGLTALLMAPPEDCFAISTPYQTEGHGSTYLSLFGRDLKPGVPARARSRLLILSKPGDAEILKAYDDYVKAPRRK